MDPNWSYWIIVMLSLCLLLNMVSILILLHLFILLSQWSMSIGVLSDCRVPLHMILCGISSLAHHILLPFHLFLACPLLSGILYWPDRAWWRMVRSEPGHVPSYTLEIWTNTDGDTTQWGQDQVTDALYHSTCRLEGRSKSHLKAEGWSRSQLQATGESRSQLQATGGSKSQLQATGGSRS